MSQDGAEKAVKKIPHFNTMADYAARQALSERGVGSLRQGQAAQWGEQKIHSREQGSRMAVPEHVAYPESGKHLNAQQFEKAGQGTMFRQEYTGKERTRMSATPRGYTPHNTFEPGSQWDF
jgi:hypothetical protein